jgi:hypothetical protein
MIRNRKAKLLAVGAAAVLGTVAATGTAHADTATASSYNTHGVLLSYATSYGDNGAVKVCDTLTDGYGASVEYVRVVTSGSATVWNEDDDGGCVSSSNIVSNPVHAFRECVDIPGPDLCTDWVYTGR